MKIVIYNCCSRTICDHNLIRYGYLVSIQVDTPSAQGYLQQNVPILNQQNLLSGHLDIAGGIVGVAADKNYNNSYRNVARFLGHIFFEKSESERAPIHNDE